MEMVFLQYGCEDVYLDALCVKTASYTPCNDTASLRCELADVHPGRPVVGNFYHMLQMIIKTVASDCVFNPAIFKENVQGRKHPGSHGCAFAEPELNKTDVGTPSNPRPL